MTEEKKPVSMYTGLGHVEIASNQGHQNGIEEIINEFVEYFTSFAKISLAAFLLLQSRRRKPSNLGDLDQLVTSDLPTEELEMTGEKHLP